MLCHLPVTYSCVTKLYRGLHWKYWREVFISSRVCNYDTAPIGNSIAVHARLAITTNFFGRFLLTTKHKRQGLNAGSSVHRSDTKPPSQGSLEALRKPFVEAKKKEKASHKQTESFFIDNLQRWKKNVFSWRLSPPPPCCNLVKKKFQSRGNRVKAELKGGLCSTNWGWYNTDHWNCNLINWVR